ncbi:MAG: hypothetical protein ACOCUO_01505 [archaeon]
MTAYGDLPVHDSASVDSADNDDGLNLELQIDGRPFVNLYYEVGDDAEIDVQFRNSVDGDWKTYTTLDTSESDTDAESLEQYPWLSYNYARVKTDTTDIDVSFDLSAGR